MCLYSRAFQYNLLSRYNFSYFICHFYSFRLTGLPNITSDLHAPPIATTLTAALFALAMGIAPMFWASLSDFYQVRRVLFLFSMIIFAAASIGCAFINNIWGLVVLRCVQSCGSSCGQSVGAGVIAVSLISSQYFFNYIRTATLLKKEELRLVNTFLVCFLVPCWVLLLEVF